MGPYARIRPDTVLSEGSVVGNFVEVKKSVIGPESKVNHLSYIGDAKIGEKVNIGAGTITCNYDGVINTKLISRTKHSSVQILCLSPQSQSERNQLQLVDQL